MFYTYFCVFFDVKLIVDKRGAPEAPPTHYPINFRKKMKHIQKYLKIYKDGGGAKIAKKVLCKST